MQTISKIFIALVAVLFSASLTFAEGIGTSISSQDDGITAPSGVVTLCPKGTGTADGCSGAPIAGPNTVQHSNFFTSYAKQSGQSYTTRPPWNVAGVDYPVGNPMTVLKDPNTNSGSLPAGCSYLTAPYNFVFCSTGASLNGWDFSLNNGTLVEFGAAATGTCQVINSNFVSGTNSVQNGPGFVTIDTGASCNVDVEYNHVDFNAPSFPQYPKEFVQNLSTGTYTSQYNAILRATGLVDISWTGAYLSRYNYVEGLNYNSGTHGEWPNIGGANSGTTVSAQWSFDTFLGPKDYGGGQTTIIYVSGGSSVGNPVITTATIDHNVFVQNLFYIQQAGISNGSGGAGTILNVTSYSAASIAQALGIGGFTRLAGAVQNVTSIVSDGTGAGGLGTYNVNISQFIAPGNTIAYAPNTGGAIQFAGVSVPNIAINNNYIDPTGFSVGSGSCFSDAGGGTPGRGVPVMSGDINLTDGSAIDGTPTVAGGVITFNDTCHNHAP